MFRRMYKHRNLCFCYSSANNSSSSVIKILSLSSVRAKMFLSFRCCCCCGFFFFFWFCCCQQSYISNLYGWNNAAEQVCIERTVFFFCNPPRPVVGCSQKALLEFRSCRERHDHAIFDLANTENDFQSTSHKRLCTFQHKTPLLIIIGRQLHPSSVVG